MSDLTRVAAQLVEAGKGILAADESVKTMSARLEATGVAPTRRNRRDYRELLLTAPGLSETVSAIILSDETFGETLADGTDVPKACRDRNILPGVKVDTGTSLLPQGNGAMVTEGLDGLGSRLASYAGRGAAFAKWRAVIDVNTVSDYSLDANAHALARYAALCQEHGVVPIVEPEVLCNGGHDLGASADVTARALATVFEHLERNRVELDGIVLKPNTITPGLDGAPATADTVAATTLGVLRQHVPAAVPGIAFLSGGHANEQACEILGAINERADDAPWNLTYSFGRALVSDALRTWAGHPEKADEAQARLLENCYRASRSVLRRPAVARAH